jgi:predicted acyl esterase
MRVTRLLRCAAAVVVTWRLIAGVPPASAQPPIGSHSFIVTAHSYSVMDGPTNSHLETLDTDLCLPDNASTATPQPAMLLTHGFGLSKSAIEMTSAASYFARHGYVVLVYSSSDPALESLAFTSAPFAHDTTSIGVLAAHLHVSHVNGQDVFLFGKVYDVAPDGTATLIHRLIAPVRLPAAQLTVSDVVDMKLLGFAHTFAAGHAVRFEVATTDVTSTS